MMKATQDSHGDKQIYKRYWGAEEVANMCVDVYDTLKKKKNSDTCCNVETTEDVVRMETDLFQKWQQKNHFREMAVDIKYHWTIHLKVIIF